MQSVPMIEKSFWDLFYDIKVPDEVHKLFQNVRIQNVNVYKKSRSLEINAHSDELISYKNIYSVERAMVELFKMESIAIKIKFNVNLSLEEALNKYWKSIVHFVNSKIAVSRGILNGCDWKLSDNKLIITLKAKGSEVLKHHGCIGMIENAIEDAFSQSVKVEMFDCSMDEEKIKEHIGFIESEEIKALGNTAPYIPEIKSEKKQTMVQGSNSGNPNVVLGKPFTDSIIKMVQITSDSGRVAFKGDVFSVDFREIRGGKYIFMFDITDFSSSITVKFFCEKEKLEGFKEKINDKVALKVRGDAQYDRFSKELTVFASDIIQVERVKRVMDEAKEKRVELHLHSQLSAMDGVTPVKELVKRAAEWGHKAIAITDHGVVQAYPDAYDMSKKSGIKVIYGLECYLLDDNVPVVTNSNGQSIDDEFVVLDIETTGLSVAKDKITEIGAVKIKAGEIIGKFSCFVNPEMPIPYNIVTLTGITDEMVKDASTIDVVLPDFIDFIKDAPLVAHNAPFDLGFIKKHARAIEKNIENPIVDTLQLSRIMFPDLGKHKLNIVAKHLGVELLNHHRAIDDATATAHIFIKCLEILNGKGATNIDDLLNGYNIEFDYKKAKTYHAIVLVKDLIGLKNLYKMVSESHLKYFYKKPRVPKKLLMDYKEGLILGSACEAGELYSAILNGKNDDELAEIVRFYDYLEIQPLGNNQFMINNGTVKNEEDLKEINRKIVGLGEKFNKPVVATCDVHFIDPRDEVFRRILMAGQGYTDSDNQAPLYFRTTDEMLAEFSYLGEEKAFEVVVTNTNLIADMVESIAPVPSGTFPPHIDGCEDEIKNLAMNKAYEIYGDPLPEVVSQRLEKELNSIIKNGFSVMYLIAQKLVFKSVSDGYLVGSRGSVGSSFVANMTGITEVNSLQPHYICEKCKYSEFILDGRVDCGFDLPEKDCPNCGSSLKRDGYDIPFETFLGFDGDKEPDIDLNFSGDYQPKAHKYTEELFGEGHVFRAGTLGSVAEKTAYGYVKNYLDDRNTPATNAEINRLVKGCTGVKRTTGQHPGGIMIVPQEKEIYDFSPIQHPADDVSSEIITTHFDYHFLHGSILKLDILGHDDPTVIRMLEDLTGIDATTIPIGEKKTMGLFSSTEALGVKPEDISSDVGTFAVPEFGTKFVRQMLVDTKPTTFSELIKISGLSHGTDVWLNNAQDLVKNGVTTLKEAICCRDDIMIYLLHKGLKPKNAFKIMEDVRKGKGVKEEYEQEMKENKVPDWYLQSCKKIKYMFPKAHAAAYVMMAFRIAWFKVYYPEAFYCTYFTVRADDFDAVIMTNGQDLVRKKITEYEQKGNTATQKEKNVLTILEVVNEMYARGFKFVPIDIYESDSYKFQITPNGFRPPLNAIQGLGGSAAQNIVEARKEKKFLSIDDLRVRAKVSKTVIEIMTEQGCLKGLPESNQISIFNLL